MLWSELTEYDHGNAPVNLEVFVNGKLILAQLDDIDYDEQENTVYLVSNSEAIVFEDADATT